MIRWLRRLLTKPRRYWYAVKYTRTQAWLVDPVGLDYSCEFGASRWFDTPVEAARSLTVHGLEHDGHTLVRLAAQPDTNHYQMTEVPWP